jgi:Undecaprenyl-phosphate glucose phosphotransferase
LALFPDISAVIGAPATLGIGVTAAGLAVALRRACREGPEQPLDRTATRAAIAVAVAIATVVTLWWVTSRDERVTPDVVGWVLTWIIASAAASVGLRHAAARRAASVTQGRRVVLVGATEQAEALARAMAQAPQPGGRVVGRIDDRDAGWPERLAAIFEHGGADEVVLTMSGSELQTRVATVCEIIADQTVRVRLAVEAASLPWRGSQVSVGRFVLFDLLTEPHGGLGGAAKRVIDVILGGIAILCLAPVLALAALAIRLESPGPVLFRQWRFGNKSRPILVFKFRTMRTDACDATGERRTTASDPRVTRVGRILRRTSMDELPQLLNVLRGEMSLVGPRPHPLHMRVGGGFYFEMVERYRLRHAVKPGITGWAQVNGARGEVDTLEKARRRVELDLWYIENWSLALDLRILLRTALGGFATLKAD